MSNQNSTIKYSAIASAVALACAGASVGSAGTIASLNVPVYSAQGHAAASADDDNVFVGTGAAASFSLSLGTAYAVNDTIVLSISGAQFRTSASLPGQIVCAKNGSASTVVLSWLSKTASSATLRVTEGTGLDGMAGASCGMPVASFSFTRRSATTVGLSSISLGMTSYVGGNTSQPFDTTASLTVGAVANQFGATVAAANVFSGTVDVNNDRKTWTQANNRTLIVSFSSTANTNAAAGANVSTSYSVSGAAGATMFSFLDDDGNGCTASDLTAGPGSASVSGGTLSVSADCATLTVTETALVGSLTIDAGRTITLAKATASTGLQIQDGSFTVSPVFTVSISTTTTQSVTAFAAGSFNLNGTVITVPYMPYGLSGTQEISQVYSVANTGATSGTVTAVARNQSGSLCSLGSVGVASARSVTNLSAAINQGIAACYAGSSTAAASAFPTGTRVFVTLTSNTPAADTVVNSTYNVGGSSRVNVINTSTRVTNN
jgi:hypothetical protein